MEGSFKGEGFSLQGGGSLGRNLRNWPIANDHITDRL